MNLDELDLSKLDKYLNDGIRSYFYLKSGKEHYRLLYSMCQGLDLVYDIGTHKGASAVAMSSAKQVKTFDVSDQLECTLPDNVTFSTENYLTKDILKADLILIDIDHEAKTEKKILDYLKKHNYKGKVILDDIFYSTKMTNLWHKIEQRKEDYTFLGHYSGTGVVYFE